MRRRETGELFNGAAVTAMARPVFDIRGAGVGSLGMLLVLFLCGRAALAEPADLPNVAVAPPAAVSFIDADSPPEPQSVLVVEPPAVERVQTDLGELLYVRDGVIGLWRPQTDDEVLAIAVAGGNNPDLEPRNPFRKRNVDLFRAERPVTIGRKDMVVRLRMRAKLKRAVSVEFRF
jgi:hypothetical protein